MDLKKKIIITSAVSGLITLILIAFIIYPLLKEIKKNSDELATTKRNLFVFQDKTGSLQQIKKTYKDLEPTFEKIKELFVDPETPIDLIKFWEKTARDSEISIDISLASLKVPESDPWGSIGFQLVSAGSFPEFLKFLEKIEAGSYLVEIQSLFVKKLGERDLRLTKYEKLSPGDVSVTLLTKVFTNQDETKNQ